MNEKTFCGRAPSKTAVPSLMTTRPFYEPGVQPGPVAGRAGFDFGRVSVNAPIQRNKEKRGFGSGTPRFQKMFVSGTGLYGHVLGEREEEEQRPSLSDEPEPPRAFPPLPMAQPIHPRDLEPEQPRAVAPMSMAQPSHSSFIEPEQPRAVAPMSMARPSHSSFIEPEQPRAVAPMSMARPSHSSSLEPALDRAATSAAMEKPSHPERLQEEQPDPSHLPAPQPAHGRVSTPAERRDLHNEVSKMLGIPVNATTWGDPQRGVEKVKDKKEKERLAALEAGNVAAQNLSGEVRRRLDEAHGKPPELDGEVRGVGDEHVFRNAAIATELGAGVCDHFSAVTAVNAKLAGFGNVQTKQTHNHRWTTVDGRDVDPWKYPEHGEHEPQTAIATQDFAAGLSAHEVGERFDIERERTKKVLHDMRTSGEHTTDFEKHQHLINARAADGGWGSVKSRSRLAAEEAVRQAEQVAAREKKLLLLKGAGGGS